MRRKYYILDVFTEKALTGNPLAVVVDCDGLDHAAMQAIAREFNLSETVFVLEPQDPVNTARLRIFTPQTELPFAGHPTVGAAVLVAALRAPALLKSQDLRVVLEEAIGEIVCTVSHRPNSSRKAHFIVPNLLSQTGAPPSSDVLGKALGLGPADIGFDAHAPSVWSAGVPFTFVPVAGLDAIVRAAPRLDLLDAALTESGARGVYLYTRETVAPEHDFHTRMFAPGLGVREDPATGSAAAAFAGVIVAFETTPDGSHALVIEQGFEINRPSLITLTLDIADAQLVEAGIGGAAVIVAEGWLDL